jgi:Ca-activated chloride channel family protein
VQRELASRDFLRPSVADVPLASGLGTAAVAELSFPNRLEVIDAVLGAYQGQWRRPATSIFVLDVSGSMEGERLRAMREALKVLAGADAQVASARYSRFQSRERVALIAFSDRVDEPVEINFETQAVDAARAQVLAFADGLKVRGGTGIYAALLRAQALARQELQKDPGRAVTVVLLTDGENNVGPDFKSFQQGLGTEAPVRVFPILFGEASPADMAGLAQFTGGRVFDGRKAALAQVFKEIRGYQ